MTILSPVTIEIVKLNNSSFNEGMRIKICEQILVSLMFNYSKLHKSHHLSSYDDLTVLLFENKRYNSKQTTNKQINVFRCLENTYVITRRMLLKYDRYFSTSLYFMTFSMFHYHCKEGFYNEITISYETG